MAISINKLEMKDTKGNRKWIEEEKKKVGADLDVDKIVEKKIEEELNSLYIKFTDTPIVKYDDGMIYEGIDKKANKKNITIDKNNKKDLYRQISGEGLIYYKIAEFKKEDKKLLFSLWHEDFEIDQFREEIIPTYSSLYASVSIEINSPYALVTINGRPVIFGAVRSLIRNFISNIFTINTVSWDNNALRGIRKEFADKTIILGAKGIEGNITARATSKNLNNTSMDNDLGKGDITLVKFTFKKLYPENDILINGTQGYISTSLSDDDAKDFVKQYLLKYASN